MIDPRFHEIEAHLSAARLASNKGDEQTILLELYLVREIAWEINKDILGKRWIERTKAASPHRYVKPTIDDLLI
jgi:hypothetical protein